MSNLIQPRLQFLTSELATSAIDSVVRTLVHSPLNQYIGLKDLHIVVLTRTEGIVPAMNFPGDWKKLPTNAALVAESSYGFKNEWSQPYDDQARNDAINRADVPPDVPIWGTAVDRDGLIVAAIGSKRHFDGMISVMVITMCHHLCDKAVSEWGSKNPNADFI